MRVLAWIAAALLFAVAFSTAAEAKVRIRVNLATQTMHVSSASGDYAWPISSARAGFRTPRGSYGVQSLQAMHRSRKYHNSPMPHSIFFSGGYAIHGTYATAALGRPASHGCIRLAPQNAAALFQMVRAEGASISIQGSAPASEYRYAERRHDRVAAAYRHAERRYAKARNYRLGDGYAMRGRYDEFEPLGYAPVVAPSFYRWMADPAGY